MTHDDPRSVHDSGTTLIEVLIVTLLIGLVATVIAATFTIIARTNPANEDRVDGSRSVLGLTAWLPEDVSSSPAGTFAEGGGIGLGELTCGLADGTALAAVRAPDPASGVVYGRDYRLVTSSSGAASIERRACVGGVLVDSVRVTGPLSAPSSCPGSTLTSPAVASAIVDPDSLVIGVKIDLLVDCDEVRVDATSNNPAEPPLNPSNTTPTPTTTPNQAPAVQPTDTTFEMYAGDTVVFTVPASDPDGDDLTLTFDNVPPELTVALGVAPGTLSITAAGGLPPGALDPFDFGVDDGRGGSAAGRVLVSIVPTTTSTTSSTTSSTSTTTVPCTGASITTSGPISVSNGGKDNVGTLNKGFTVEINPGSNCPELGLLFDPLNDDASAPTSPSLRWEPFSGATSLTIDKKDYSWSDGSHTLELRNDSDNPTIIATIVVVVSP